jgi:hypothetical protein
MLDERETMSKLVHFMNLDRRLQVLRTAYGVWRAALPFKIHHSPFTKFNSVVWALASCLLLFVTGCGQPPLQPLIFNQPPWSAGEISQYRITDVNGAVVGSARFDILGGDPQTNAGGWSIRREIAAQGVNEVIAVEVGENLRPQTAVVIRSSNQGQQIVKATYRGSQVDMELTSAQNVTTYESRNITSDARDYAVLLQALRLLPLEPDYATRLNTFSVMTGLLETFTIQVVGSEEVTTPAGSFTTWKVEAKTADTMTTAWVAQKAPVVLVKYVDGRNDGAFELVDFQPGE